MMVIDNLFSLGDTVYLTTDNDQRRRIVTQIKVTPSGLLYNLSCGTCNSDHYECEISETSNILAKIE